MKYILDRREIICIIRNAVMRTGDSVSRRTKILTANKSVKLGIPFEKEGLEWTNIGWTMDRLDE